MKLNDLKAMGGFVPAEPVKREVSWTREVDGKPETVEFTVFVRRQSFGSVERLLHVENDDRSRSARFLSESILLGDDGKEKLSYEDAYRLEPGLAAVLMEAVADVNGTGRKQGKN